MPYLVPSWSSLPAAAGWSLATLAAYGLARRAHRRWPRWWLSPLATAPALLVAALAGLHASYGEYLRGTGWLVGLLGPVTVAFAVPIHEQRRMIRAHWPVLAAGVAVGSSVAVLSSWLLATAAGLQGTLRLSLLPRSISTPFAMAVAGDIGGSPQLTAAFVVVTGVLGASLGEVLLARLPVRASLARGSLLGMGAHGVGTARAQELGAEEGAIAGLVMVLVGVVNVLLAPLLVQLLR